jgi:tRNA(adenine34) deaminase
MKALDFLSKALELAEAAALRGEVPVGAVIVHQDKIIGAGSNTREAEQDPTRHAEVIAIQAAAKSLGSWRLIDCDLYVTLEPCPMCLSACQQARVRKVVYGAKDEKGGAICLGFHIHAHARTNHRFEVEYLPSEACSEVLKKFFANKRSEKKSPC